MCYNFKTKTLKYCLKIGSLEGTYPTYVVINQRSYTWVKDELSYFDAGDVCLTDLGRGSRGKVLGRCPHVRVMDSLIRQCNHRHCLKTSHVLVR